MVKRLINILLSDTNLKKKTENYNDLVKCNGYDQF